MLAITFYPLTNDFFSEAQPKTEQTVQIEDNAPTERREMKQEEKEQDEQGTANASDMMSDRNPVQCQ